VPSGWAAVMAVTLVGLVTVKLEAAVEPKFTEVVFVKCVPERVTVVPPKLHPFAGEMPESIGGTSKVNSPREKTPVGVVTEILTGPGAWALVTAVMVVELVTVNRVAAVVPNLTAVAPKKCMPVMVTVVPPATGPPLGEKPVMQPLSTTTIAARRTATIGRRQSRRDRLAVRSLRLAASLGCPKDVCSDASDSDRCPSAPARRTTHPLA